jgi:WD40 repeat protein
VRPGRFGLTTLVSVAVVLGGLGLYSWHRRPTGMEGPPSALDRLSVVPSPAPASLGAFPELVGTPGRSFGERRSVFSGVAVSSDGRLLATGERNGTVSLWDAATLRPLAEGKGHRAPVLALAFSPDGRTLASGGQEALCLWRLPEEGEDESLTLFFRQSRNWPVINLAFSPDGQSLAGSCGFKDLFLWRVTPEGLTLDCERSPDNGPVRSLAFSPDGRTLAVGGTGIWSWSVGETLAERPDRLLDGKAWLVQSVAFTAAGDRLRTLDADGHLLVRDANGGLLRELKVPGRISRAAFAPDGRHLLVVNFDGTLSIYRFAPDPGM